MYTSVNNLGHPSGVVGNLVKTPVYLYRFFSESMAEGEMGRGSLLCAGTALAFAVFKSIKNTSPFKYINNCFNG